ncbi:MAG: hypothetical protein P1V20_06115 [Verrucomicrobiales bacterium]|nr:hypothetical protein [Verrucomicrobiales bacterium]
MSPFFVEQSKVIVKDSGYEVVESAIPPNFAHFVVQKNGIQGSVVCVDDSRCITAANLVLAQNRARQSGAEVKVIVAKVGDFSPEVLQTADELDIRLVRASAVRRAEKTSPADSPLTECKVEIPPLRKASSNSSGWKKRLEKIPVMPGVVVVGLVIAIAIFSAVIFRLPRSMDAGNSGDALSLNRASEENRNLEPGNSALDQVEQVTVAVNPLQSTKKKSVQSDSGKLDFSDLKPSQFASKLSEIFDESDEMGFNFVEEFGNDVNNIVSAICEGSYIKDPTNPHYLKKVGGNFEFNSSLQYNTAQFLLLKDNKLVYIPDRDECMRLRVERGAHKRIELPVPAELPGLLKDREGSGKRPATGFSSYPLPITEATPNHANSRIEKLKKYYEKNLRVESLYIEDKELAKTLIRILVNEIPKYELSKIVPRLNKIALTRTDEVPAFVLGMLPWIDKDIAIDAAEELEQHLERYSDPLLHFHLQSWRAKIKPYGSFKQFKDAAVELVNRTRGFKAYDDDEIMWLFYNDFHPSEKGRVYSNVFTDALISYKELRPWLLNFAVGEHLSVCSRCHMPWWEDHTIQDWIRPLLYAQRAKVVLEKAWELKPDLPAIAAAMISVSSCCSETPIKDMRYWFDQCVALRSDYSRAYKYYIEGIDPKMHGSIDELWDFAHLCVGAGLFKTSIPDQIFEIQKGLVSAKRTDFPTFWRNMTDSEMELFDAYYAGKAFKGVESFRNVICSHATVFFYRCGNDDLMLKWFKLTGGNLDDDVLLETGESGFGIMMKIQEVISNKNIEQPGEISTGLEGFTA